LEIRLIWWGNDERLDILFQVFCELERALTNELDFLAEAQAMEKVMMMAWAAYYH